MSDDITRYIAFEGMTREDAKEWMHDMAARCAVDDSKFMDGQSEEWKALFRQPAPHHNARPPRKVRKHEHRRARSRKPWILHAYGVRMLSRTPYQFHPEPDGA